MKMSITCMRGMQRTHVRYRIKLQWSHVALQTYENKQTNLLECEKHDENWSATWQARAKDIHSLNAGKWINNKVTEDSNVCEM